MTLHRLRACNALELMSLAASMPLAQPGFLTDIGLLWHVILARSRGKWGRASCVLQFDVKSLQHHSYGLLPYGEHLIVLDDSFQLIPLCQA